jgi:hypothetical protein
MYLWAAKAIASALLGTASATYIKNTKLGRWLYGKFEMIANYIKDRWGIDMLDSAEAKWQTRYPKLIEKINQLELRIKKLEGKNG